MRFFRSWQRLCWFKTCVIDDVLDWCTVSAQDASRALGLPWSYPNPGKLSVNAADYYGWRRCRAGPRWELTMAMRVHFLQDVARPLCRFQEDALSGRDRMGPSSQSIWSFWSKLWWRPREFEYHNRRQPKGGLVGDGDLPWFSCVKRWEYLWLQQRQGASLSSENAAKEPRLSI